MTKKMTRLAVAVLCVAVSTGVLGADPTYAVKELTQFARATDINNLGDIVGWRHPSQGILLRNGQSQVNVIGSLGTFPRAINDNAQVVGEALQGSTYQAFLYSTGVIRYLGALPGHTESGATDINARGQITGWSRSGSLTLPFFHSSGRMTAMDAIGGRSATPNAINDRGGVVGNAELDECDGIPPVVIRPFIGSMGMAGLGGNNGQALGINGNGLVVGSEEPILDNPLTHAVAWFDGPMSRPTDLGTLPNFPNSVAKSVNKNAQIVGYSYGLQDVPESRRAFIYFSGWMFDLNERLATSGWLIREAIAINDNGQIVAEGCDTTQARCGLAILLTPMTATKPPRRR